MDQGVSGRSVGGLEAHGEGSQAALGGALEGLAVLQQSPVEVEADVSLQTLREALQNLGRGREESQLRVGVYVCVYQVGVSNQPVLTSGNQTYSHYPDQPQYGPSHQRSLAPTHIPPLTAFMSMPLV